jgi:ABC-type maltose transport system permease subunit
VCTLLLAGCGSGDELLTRIDFAGRRHLLLAMLALQMISPLVLAFPLYRYFASLGLLNNLPATGLVYIAVLMRWRRGCSRASSTGSRATSTRRR